MRYLAIRGKVTIEIYDEMKYKKESEVIEEIHYSGAIEWEVVHGDRATEIEKDLDCIDPLHEYLVLYLKNGKTATFRNSFVDMFLF